MNRVIGEVVNVESLTSVQIQQIEGGDEVKLGKFVFIEGHNIIGVLGDISILNPEFGSYPRPKRLPDNIEIANLYPDLVEQFPTIITVYVLGYFNNNQFYQEIPFRPPSIYTKVRFATQEEIINFHKSDNDELPQLSYLMRLQEFNRTPVMDTLLRILLSNISDLFDITIEEILEVMS